MAPLRVARSLGPCQPASCAKPSGAAEVSWQPAKLFPPNMNGSIRDHGANTPPRHFQRLAPGNPKRPKALNTQRRNTGAKSALNGSCSQSNAGRERKSQFPQTLGPFLLKLYTDSFRVGKAAWLRILCLLGGSCWKRVEMPERMCRLHLDKLGN